MEYIVKINEFDGPLDLLLHLIKESNIEICNIKIEEITKQYLDYINKMEELNLNVASEYLLMASELIEIKSKSLLPRKEVEEEIEEEDPREKLIEKLIEYNYYKKVCKSFEKMEEERKKIHTKEPSLGKEYIKAEEFTDDINLDDLANIFKKFLEKKQLEKPLETKITKKEYSVKKRNIEIKNLLKTKKQVYFEELFDIVQKDYIVVTFLSILDLARKGELLIKQGSNFEEIILIDKEN